MRAIGILAMALLVSVAQAAELPLSTFTRQGGITSAKISPDGKYLAMTLSNDGQREFRVVRLNDRKVTISAAQEGWHDLASYWWATDDRLLLVPAAITAGKDVLATGEIISVEADGTGASYLYGYHGQRESQIGSAIKRPQTLHYGSATYVSPQARDDKHVVIAVDDWRPTDSSRQAESAAETLRIHTYQYLPDGRDFINDCMLPPAPGTRPMPSCAIETVLHLIGYAQQTQLFSLNLESGALRFLGDAPDLGFSRFWADANGIPRFAVGHIDGKTFAYARDAGGKLVPADSWHKLGALDESVDQPLTVSPDGQSVFLRSTLDRNFFCLDQLSLANGQRHSLVCDDDRDLDHVVLGADGLTPVAASYLNDRPQLQIIEDKDGLLDSLKQAFPDEYAEPVSFTRDGSRIVLRVTSDRHGPRYYLFDRSSGVAMRLSPDDTKLDVQMAERRPVSFTARDGTTIHGFLTLPTIHTPKPAPLIVRVHDDPFSSADRWEWDAEAQMFASHGYPVLQINYRGSAGYGRQFAAGGRRSWDDAMVTDIVDGTRWAIQQKLALPHRVCAYGVGFGAYLAFSAAISAPADYRCIIGLGGVYDLADWSQSARTEDSGYTSLGTADQLEGATPQRLKAASPMAHLDQLKSSILIAYGTQDEKVSIAQSRRLGSALDQREDAVVTMLPLENQGHVAGDPAARENCYRQMLTFIDQSMRGKINVGGVQPLH